MDHESRQRCGSCSSQLSISPLTLSRRRPPYLVNSSAANHFSEAEHCASTPSDSAVKQILLTMNERDNFIVEDLDDFHVIIKADEEYRVRKQLELEVRAAVPHHTSRNTALMFLSVGEEHVQFGMIHVDVTKDVYALVQARSRVYVLL